jgi:hypothetical protein
VRQGRRLGPRCANDARQCFLKNAVLRYVYDGRRKEPLDRREGHHRAPGLLDRSKVLQNQPTQSNTSKQDHRANNDEHQSTQSTASETRRPGVTRPHDEVEELQPSPVLQHVSQPSEIEERPSAAMEERTTKDQEIRNEIAQLEQTPLKELSEVLPKVLQRLQHLAESDNNILHQGSLLSRLSFPNITVDNLLKLKNFAGSTSTWQWIDNPSGHRAFKSGNRRDFCRTLCTVETALLVLANVTFRNSCKQAVLSSIQTRSCRD